MNLDSIKNKDILYKLERIEPYFASSIIIRGMVDQGRVRKILRWKRGVRWLYTNDCFFTLKQDTAAAQAEIGEKLKNGGKNYVQSLVEECFRHGQKLLAVSRAVGTAARKTALSTSEMRELLSRYAAAASTYMIFQNIALFEEPLGKLAKRLASKHADSETGTARLLELITTPSRLTAAETEKDDFLRLCSVQPSRQSLAAHAKKYGWLSIRFFLGNPWTAQDIAARAKSVPPAAARAQLTKRLLERERREKQIQNAISGFSPRQKELVDLIRNLVFLRTQRTDFFQESSSYVQRLVKKIAETLKVSYTDLLYLSAREVLLSLRENFDYLKHVQNRKTGFLVLFDYDSDKILEGANAVHYIRQRPVLHARAAGAARLSGKTGFPGKATGTVKIVKTDRDNPKVKKGDILVAIMTTSNFIPAMEKAAAFVTDEGGITCHAAIIAREMKKPCIIGTQAATRTLHDGDLVEVDATKGTVKIIK